VTLTRYLRFRERARIVLLVVAILCDLARLWEGR
jgi:hypothetical protein